MNEGPAPRIADDLGTEDHVTELAGQAVGKLVPSVDRKRERVGCLVDAEMVVLQLTDLVRPDERQPELAGFDPLRGEHVLRDGDGRLDVQLGTAPVYDLDVDHLGYFLRCVPVSSACSL